MLRTGLFSILLVTSCVAVGNVGQDSFSIKDIGCENKLSKEEQEKIETKGKKLLEELYRHWRKGGKDWFRATLDKESKAKSLQIMRKIVDSSKRALKGGAEWSPSWAAWVMYGITRFDLSYKLNDSDGLYHYDSLKIMPDVARSDIVSALTYLYIASEVYRDSRAIEPIEVVEGRSESDFVFTKVDQDWIEEAKQNVLSWREYCGK